MQQLVYVHTLMDSLVAAVEKKTIHKTSNFNLQKYTGANKYIIFIFIWLFVSVLDGLLKSIGVEQYALSYKAIEKITAIAVLPFFF